MYTYIHMKILYSPFRTSNIPVPMRMNNMRIFAFSKVEYSSFEHLSRESDKLRYIYVYTYIFIYIHSYIYIIYININIHTSISFVSSGTLVATTSLPDFCITLTIKKLTFCHCFRMYSGWGCIPRLSFWKDFGKDFFFLSLRISTLRMFSAAVILKSST